MGQVQAIRVRAVRPRICGVCRRTINPGDVYERFVITDPVSGMQRVIKGCLNHEDDDPETDTRTTAMRRLTVKQLEEMYPPAEGDAPQDGGVTDPVPAASYAGHPLSDSAEVRHMAEWLQATDVLHAYPPEHWLFVARDWFARRP